MSESGIERVLLEGARLERGDDVLVLGDGRLVFGAHDLVGEGWVYVVRSQVDDLEELFAEAHAAGASGLAYLVGATPVLPLPDAAVVAAVGRVATEDGSLGAAAQELARVLAPQGRVALAEGDGQRGDALARALEGAGFGGIELAEPVEPAGEVVVTAHLA